MGERACLLAMIVLCCARRDAWAQHEGMMMPMPPPVGWAASFNANAFGQYIDQKTRHGGTQLRLNDWEMWMAAHRGPRATLHLSLMTSLEPLIESGHGTLQLLQTGGTFEHGYIHDYQHAHDVVSELSASYERRLGSAASVTVDVAPVGNPALGPTPYLHRSSAADDPFAPLGHHWQDASHGSYGVGTVGLDVSGLRLEGSVFNARESDYDKPWPDYRGARLDSYAGRLSWGSSAVEVMTWWGYLGSHDPIEPLTRMHRYGGSLSTNLHGTKGGAWSTTAIWGMNVHHHGGLNHALLHGDPNASPHHHASSMLLETTLGVGRHADLFGRIERVMKSGEELGFLGGDLTLLYDVRALSVGAHRDVANMRAVHLGLGLQGTQNFVPESLRITYGTRRPRGLSVYATMRVM